MGKGAQKIVDFAIGPRFDISDGDEYLLRILFLNFLLERNRRVVKIPHREDDLEIRVILEAGTEQVDSQAFF